MKKIKPRKISVAGLILLIMITFGASAQELPSDQVIFPGQADPRVSAAIIAAYNHALKREYFSARALCLQMERDFPGDPSGATGEMVLYQVMMLENDDYEFDAEFSSAARKAEADSLKFFDAGSLNDWSYTLLGAAWGVQGIYYLRRDEYWDGLTCGARGLYYMQTAADRNPNNWEARMGIGLFLYYRSAYASLLHLPWFDQRKRGIAEVEMAGQKRKYLNEVSRIALYYIYMNEKDYDRARAYMDGLIAERPYFVIFYQLAGRAMIYKGDYLDAYNYYLKMQTLDPRLYIPYYKLGECALKMGKKAEAQKWFDQFLQVLGARQTPYRAKAQQYLRELNKAK